MPTPLQGLELLEKEGNHRTMDIPFQGDGVDATLVRNVVQSGRNESKSSVSMILEAKRTPSHHVRDAMRNSTTSMVP